MIEEGVITHLLRCIETEYGELPGLRLTERQMQRLWDLDRDTCSAVIARLVRRGVVMKVEGEIVKRPVRAGKRMRRRPARR
jgi:hypothetical protein